MVCDWLKGQRGRVWQQHGYDKWHKWKCHKEKYEEQLGYNNAEITNGLRCNQQIISQFIGSYTNCLFISWCLIYIFNVGRVKGSQVSVSTVTVQLNPCCYPSALLDLQLMSFESFLSALCLKWIRWFLPYESIKKTFGWNSEGHTLWYSAETLYYMYSVFMSCVGFSVLCVTAHTLLIILWCQGEMALPAARHMQLIWTLSHALCQSSVLHYIAVS